MAGLGTYWHTLRYLRPIQIYGRARLLFPKARVDLRPAPELRQPHTGTWVQPARRKPSMHGPATFSFLNHTENIADRGWDHPAVDRLWRYNLHYFDDLNAIDPDSRRVWHRGMMRRWIEENPPGAGTGWEPYPASLRIVNWIKWSLRGNELSPLCVQSLAVQARWLAGRLEIHLLGNHLLANAKALVFAGTFFAGPEADAWLETGLSVLDREIREQVLGDGGHFERSTMYHVLALEDVLDLCNVAATFADSAPRIWAPSDVWRARSPLMRHWLAAMTHPDGEIGLFNDAAVGIAPSPEEIESYAVRLGLGPRASLVDGVTRLSATGYVRLENDDAVALLDVGSVGPDYLPAHAHADTLSIELSLRGERVLVNSGTSTYANSDERSRQRGTAAHNSVVIDGENSSEVWGSFRVARRANPIGLSVAPGEPIVVRCSHDGYARLPGSPQHDRAWILAPDMLLIEDRITGRFRSAAVRLHLHPAIRVDEMVIDADRGDTAFLRSPQGEKVRISFEGGRLRQESTTWHPEFGSSIPNTCLVGEVSGPIVRTRITWGHIP